MYEHNLLVTISVLMTFYSLGSFAQISKDTATPVVRVCLHNGDIKKFNNNTHACINNLIVERKSYSLTSNLKASPLEYSLAKTITATQAAERPSAADNENSDILKCDSPRKARKSRGYKRCGYKPYHPDFQTCCKEIDYPYKVHTGKKHKDHVCCGINVYRRNSTMPCQHPARNDILWKTNKRFMKDYKARSNCLEYLMRVGAKDEQHNFKFYHATITRLENGRSADTKQVKVAIDQFSPKRTLKAKYFFIISDTIFKNRFLFLG